MEKKFLCFKGDRNEIDILHRPDFHDALLLNKLPKNSSYQQIPLLDNSQLSFQYHSEHPKKKVQYSLKDNHLIISHQENNGMVFLYSILIKEGSKISYITDSTRRKNMI